MSGASSAKDTSEMGRLSSALSRKSISSVEPRGELPDSSSSRSSEPSTTSTHGTLRRSKRDPNCAQLDRPDVRSLVEKIRKNHKDTIVFKIKDHIPSDISSSVLDEIIHSFYRNKVCQAMYVQNISRAMGDTQLKSLLELLKRKQIWCLNIGENYEVTKAGWEYFCATLPETSITHLYVSEHVIHIDLKNKMREHIRANRKKHDKHCSFKNLRVIEKCTNMWWNPINAIKHQVDQKFQPQHDHRPSATPAGASVELAPCHTAYWAEGVGEGGSTPWKFNCVCGEVCSSYERYIYHPTGRMYECTRCHVWSHVDCVLGKISNDDLEELTEVYCGPCKAKVRRQKLLEMKELNVVWENGRVVSDGNSSDDESISAAERAQLVEDNVSRLVEELNKQHCAKAATKSQVSDTTSTVDESASAIRTSSPAAAPTTPSANALLEPLIQPMNSSQPPQPCDSQQPFTLPPPPVPSMTAEEHDGCSGDHEDDGTNGSTSNESSSGDTCGSADSSVGVMPSPRSSEPESVTHCNNAPTNTCDAEAASESMIEESILSTIMHSPPMQAQPVSELAVTPMASVPFKSDVTPLLPVSTSSMSTTSVPSLSQLPIPHIEINYSIPQITNRSRARSETTTFPVDAAPLLIPNAMQNDWANKNSFLTDLNTSSAPLLIKDILSRASFGDNNRHRSFSVADMYDPRRADGADTLTTIQTLMASTDKAPPPPVTTAPPKVKSESKKSDNGKEKPAKEKTAKQTKAQMKVKTETPASDIASTENAPRKKRQSKGVRFQIYSRVYVPSVQRHGSIVQEKNGGWKYVQLDDIGDGVTDGKWCRACDMMEMEDSGAARPPQAPAQPPPSAEHMDEEMIFKRRRADSTGSDLFFGEDSLIQPHPTILTLTPDMSGFDDWPALGSTEGMDHFLEGLDAMDEWNL